MANIYPTNTVYTFDLFWLIYFNAQFIMQYRATFDLKWTQILLYI